MFSDGIRSIEFSALSEPRRRKPPWDEIPTALNLSIRSGKIENG
jgi:hypothetical protein